MKYPSLLKTCLSYFWYMGLYLAGLCFLMLAVHIQTQTIKIVVIAGLGVILGSAVQEYRDNKKSYFKNFYDGL